MPSDALLKPDWPAPANVGAAMSLRDGGVSRPPYDALNIGVAVGDEPAAVAENRRRVEAACGVPLAYLKQVHGRRVVRIGPDGPADDACEADAAWTDRPGRACAIQVADCMPVLVAARNGRAVGAAHAGWRGLAAGVVEAVVAEVAAAAACAPGELIAWLGPCIGPQAFEVGDDVVEGFGQSPRGPDPACFLHHRRADGSDAWLADLPALARRRLAGAGLEAVSGGSWCTVGDRSRFFSFRRDRVTGRMVAAIWLRG